MAERATDYPVPVDGRIHLVSCGHGRVLTVDLDDDCDQDDLQPDERECQVAFLWVHQLDDGDPRPAQTRKFTVAVGRDAWPASARHLASIRGHDDHGLTATLHVLEVLT